MLKNGRMTPSEPLEKLLDEIDIPTSSRSWADDMLKEKIKKGVLKKFK
jgi:hypothetical protein